MSVKPLSCRRRGSLGDRFAGQATSSPVGVSARRRLTLAVNRILSRPGVAVNIVPTVYALGFDEYPQPATLVNGRTAGKSRRFSEKTRKTP